MPEVDEMLPAAVKDALKLIADQEGKYTYIEKTDGSVAKVRKTLKQVYGELPIGDFAWADR